MKLISILILTVLIFTSVSLAQTNTQSKETAKSEGNLKKAEQVVIRAMKIFAATLDFKQVFQAAFIKDKIARKELFRADLKEDNISNFENLDNVVLEKFYTTKQNLMWLIWIRFYRSNSEDMEIFINREVLPKLSKRQRVFYKRLENGNNNQTKLEVSHKEFEEMMKVYDVFNLVIRKKFPKTLRNDLLNKVTVNGAISKYKSESLKKYTEVYDVCAAIKGMYGHFTFEVIEELGVMKIASVWIPDSNGC